MIPLMNFSVNFLYSLDDHSILSSPSWVNSLNENLGLTLGVFLGAGEKAESIEIIKPEFCSYGTSFFLKLRKFF